MCETSESSSSASPHRVSHVCRRFLQRNLCARTGGLSGHVLGYQRCSYVKPWVGWLCIVCHASQAEQSAITNTLRDQIQLCLNVQLLQRVVWFPVCVNCRELVEHWDMFASQARQNLAPYCKPFSDGNSQNVEAAMIKEDQILKVSLWTHESRQAATNSIQLESTGSRKSPVTAHKVQQSAQSKLPHLNAHPPPMLSKKPIQVTRVQIQRIVQMPPQQINVQQHPQPMGDDEPPLQVQQPEIADICSMPQKFQALQPQVEEPQEDPAENTQVHAWEMVDIKDEPLPEIGDLETEPIESVLVSQVAAEPEVEESVSAHLDPLMISPSSSADHRQRQLTKRQAVGLKWKKALRKKRVTQPKLQHKSVEIVTVAAHPSSSSNQPPTAAPTPSETGLKFVQLSHLLGEHSTIPASSISTVTPEMANELSSISTSKSSTIIVPDVSEGPELSDNDSINSYDRDGSATIPKFPAKKLVCELCSVQCFTIRQMRRHMTLHFKQGKKLVCQTCDMKFSYQYEFQAHKRYSSHGDSYYVCQVCEMLFSRKRRCKEHLLHNHPFQCQICQFVAASKESFENHIFWVHAVPSLSDRCTQKNGGSLENDNIDILQIECEFCSKIFKNEDELEMHLKKHVNSKTLVKSKELKDGDIESEMIDLVDDEGEENTEDELKFPCCACPAKFSKSVDILAHLRLAHSNLTKFNCIQCPMATLYPPSYVQHMYQHFHNKRVRYRCPYCSAIRADKNNLVNKHLGGNIPPGVSIDSCRVFGNIKKEKIPYHCEICNEIYNIRNNSSKHRSKHLKKTNLICNVCNKKYLFQCSLSNHIKFNHKIFKCPYCNVVINNSERKFKIHIKKFHNGHPAFICNECKTGFKTQKALLKHSKLHTDTRIITHVSESTGDSQVKNISKKLMNITRLTVPRKRKGAARKVPKSPCPHCDIVFPSEMEMRMHVVLVHAGIPFYSCSLCGQAQIKGRFMLKHMAKFHGEKSSTTMDDSSGASSKAAKQGKFTCKECEINFSMQSKYKAHMSKHKTTKTCKNCKKSLNLINFNSHVIQCKDKSCDKYLCSQCPSKFTFKCDLKKHILAHLKSISSEIQTYNSNIPQVSFDCKKCGLICDDEEKLKCHIKVHSQHFVNCVYCHNDIKQESFLTIHAVYCSNPESICSICGERYKNKRKLLEHLQNHVSEKVYCNICHNYFSSQFNVESHKAHHHNPGPFMCDICQTEFSYRFELITHIIKHVHTEFPCMVCQYKRNESKIGLKRHIMKNHAALIPQIIAKHL